MTRKPQPVARKKRAPCQECEKLRNHIRSRDREIQVETQSAVDAINALAAARDEAAKLREQLVDSTDNVTKARQAMLLARVERDSAIDGHDSFIASYALHSKQVLAFLDNLPMDVKGQRWMSPSKWRECVKFFEPEPVGGQS